MLVEIVTLFPGMFESVLGESIIKRARAKCALDIRIHNLRDWTSDNHRTADDKPFGGGPGMVMKIEPVYKALKELKVLGKSKAGARVILLTPQGTRLAQKEVRRIAKYKRLILICGHYEGVDERVRQLVDEEVSIGDYILTGGELPAMVLIDAAARLIPGVLGHSGSTVSESFEDGLLEYPQYTRPAEYMGMKVPEVIMSGDHKKIEKWRKAEALKRTSERRPDLLKRRR